MVDFWLDGTYSTLEPLFYVKEDIDKYIEMAQRLEGWEEGYYGITDRWLYQALETHSIRDKEVAIIGSTVPLYEGIVIAFGGKPSAIGYNKIITNDLCLWLNIPF